MARLTFQAQSTIQPSTFLTIYTGASQQCIQASGSNVFLIGVAQEYPDTAPTPGAATPAAIGGEEVLCYSVGEVCQLGSTSAGWTAGDRLTADSLGSGYGVTAVPSGGTAAYYGAIARTTLT